VNKNVVPFFHFDAKLISPPNFSTISLTITRPRPIPSWFKFLLLIESYIWNNLCWFFFLIPSPLSVTLIYNFSSFMSYLTRTTISPFLLENLMAFDIKFKRIYYSLLISVCTLKKLSSKFSNSILTLTPYVWILASNISTISYNASLMSKNFICFTKFLLLSKSE
jgi:hypothetical protein